MPNRWYKQPSETTDYDVDWTDWLIDGDTISEYQVTAEDGIDLGADDINDENTIVKQYVSGGTDGVDYKVTFRITTAQGRINERDITIMVREL